MRKCLSLLVLVALAGCPTSPVKPLTHVTGLSFEPVNGSPALTAVNPGDLTVLYASTNSDDANFFHDGRWLGTQFHFAADAFNSPGNQDRLVLPRDPATRILIARGSDEPVFYVGLDRDPCIPDDPQGEGCDGTFERLMADAYNRVSLDWGCLFQCSDRSVCGQTKRQCESSCSTRQCQIIWPPL